VAEDDRGRAEDSFAAQVQALRMRAHLTQAELAALLGVSNRTLRSWEDGRSFPDAARLRSLFVLALERGGFVDGGTDHEAAALWETVRRRGTRRLAPFDRAWFAAQRAATVPAATPHFTTEKRVDWGEAPALVALHGRTRELAELEDWAAREHVSLIALIGLGGIGKTALALALAHRLAAGYDRVLWRSLRNAPALPDLLTELLRAMADEQDANVPPDQDGRLSRLLAVLRARRCLLILDNMESVLAGGLIPDQDPRGYEGYGLLLQRLAQTAHQSLVIVTSREKPPELALLEGDGGSVCTLPVTGLDVAASQALLAETGLAGTEADWAGLVHTYAGNPLALRIVAGPVRELFAGKLATFLARGQIVFGGIRMLLDQQVGRLSSLERAVLAWLAVERVPIPFNTLATDLERVAPRAAAQEAVAILQRRSLLERGERDATFTLQPVVLEYMTDRVVADVCQEIVSGQPALLVSHALVKATAKDFVRRSQERLIVRPLLEALARVAGVARVEPSLMLLLEAWRGRSPAEQGYGPGNVVNLLRLLRGDLRGLDLSRLSIRQAYLQEVDAQDARLAHSHLAQSVLAEDFYNVFSVAFSADGSFLAAGTIDGEVRLWRVADRTPILSAHGHSGLIFGLALSGDGHLVASGGPDGTVKLWEAPSGQLLATLHGHTSQVSGVALSADGRLVASGSLDETVRLWDARSGQLLATLRGHSGIVHGVSLSPDGHLVASGGQDGTVRLWDTESGHERANLPGHTDGVWAVALSADARLVAVGCQDGTVKLWDVESGLLRATWYGHTGLVHAVALSRDGRLLASGDYHGTVRLWDVIGGRPLATLRAHAGGVFGLALSGDGRLMASGGLDGTVKLWDAAPASESVGQLQATLQGHTGIVYGLAQSAGEPVVASGGDDGTIRLWEAQSGRLQATLRGHTGIVYGVAFSADGRLVASGGEDGTLRLWDAAGASPLAVLYGHVGWVRGVAMSADGRLVVSSGQDGTVRLWSPPGGGSPGRLEATLHGHSGLVFAVAVSGDGRVMASGAYDGTVKLWEVAPASGPTGRLLTELRDHGGLIFALTLSADGRLLVSGGEDTMVRLWEVESGRLLATLEGHAGPIFGVALSADARLVASGGVDGTIKLWEADSGRLLSTLRSHTGIVYGLALSGDGQLLTSGGDDGLVKLWDVPTETCLRVLRADRRYERMDITGLTGLTGAQQAALLALGALERSPG
jgi:WD40 repeat protein/transcriptional regulator with XRE-family HTH domain